MPEASNVYRKFGMLFVRPPRGIAVKLILVSTINSMSYDMKI